MEEKQNNIQNTERTTEGSTRKTEGSHLNNDVKIDDQNSPIKQSTSKPAPQKTEKPNVSPQKLLFGFLGVCVLLISVFYGVMLWGLLSGNAANPLFETLGIKQTEIQDVLLLITNSIFGAGALIFLFASLVKFFQL